MTVNYTSLLGLALPVTGTEAGAWGDVVNNYLTSYLDASVAGTQTITGSQTAVTLAVTNGATLVTVGSGATGSAQFQIITCTGNPASLLTITAPASSRQYIIINSTSTSQSVKIVGAGPTTGVTIVSGEKAHVAWNGSDFVKIATQSGNGSFVDLTVSGNLTLSGGTANGVLYLNASKVATSGSALTFDGTKLGINGGVIGDNNLVAQINTPASSAKFMGFNRSGDYGLIIGYDQSAGDYASIRTVFDYPIVFSVNNAEQMRLTSTGLTLRQAGIPANTSVSLNTTIQNALTLEADGDLLVGTTTNTNSSKLVASGTISETVSSTQYLVASQFDIGTAANEIPLNQYLGNLAYQDAGSIAGQVGLSAGTAALPSLVSATDTDTGMWFPAANTLAWSTGGTRAMTLHSSGGFSVGTATDPGIGNIGLTNGGKLQYSATAYISPEDNVAGARIVTPGVLNVATGGTAVRMTLDASGFLVVGDTTTGSSRFTSASTSYPETTEYAGVFKAGTVSPLSNRYLLLRQTYTGGAFDSLPLVWEANADGANQKSYGVIQTIADGSIVFSNKAAGAAVAIGTALGVAERARITSTGGLITKPVATGHAVFNEDGVDADFRVESDNNQYMLWVDASADGVNIGGFDTIQGQLNVIKNTGDLVASTTALYITTGQTYGSAANKKNLDLVFQGYRDGAGTGGGAKARLRAIEQTADSRVGSLLIDVLDSAGDLQNALELTSSNVVVNQGGIDMDFRVESDTNTHALFVDAGNSRIGINQSNPTAALDMVGLGFYQYSPGASYPIKRSVTESNQGSTATTTYSLVARIDFGVSWSPGNFPVITVSRVYRDGVTNYLKYALRNESTLEIIENYNGGDVLRIKGPVTYNSNTGVYEIWIAQEAYTAYQIVFEGAWYADSIPSTPSGQSVQVLTATEVAATVTTSAPAGLTQATNFYQNIAANTESVFNEYGADLDFRVESDASTHALFVDAGSNYVGINRSATIVNGSSTVVQLAVQSVINNGAILAPGLAVTNSTGYQDAFFVSTKDNEVWLDADHLTTQAGAKTAMIFRVNKTTTAGSLTQVAKFDYSGDVIFNEDSNDHDFRVESDSDTHCLFVDAGTNRVGIGTNSPSAKLHVDVARAATITSAIFGTTGTGVVNDENRLVIKNINTASGQNYGVGIGGLLEASASNQASLLFYTDSGTATTERARITSGGTLLVGTTNTAQGAGNGNKFDPAGAVWVVNAATNDGFSYYNSSAAAYRFYVGANGTISATNTTISAISDQRLKENIRDLDVGLDAILALKPRKFDWKAGKGKDKKDDRGWIAQEFEQVFPDLIDEWKDPAPEGEEPYKSVRADLIPVLVKAIQEQQAMINELKAEVAALKGA